MKSNNVTVFEGQPALLHCVAKGSPSPRISWYRDSQPILPDARRYTVSHVPHPTPVSSRPRHQQQGASLSGLSCQSPPVQTNSQNKNVQIIIAIAVVDDDDDICYVDDDLTIIIMDVWRA